MVLQKESTFEFTIDININKQSAVHACSICRIRQSTMI